MESTARGSDEGRPGPRALLEHLDRVLGARTTAVDELDLGVLHVARAASPDWVMRVFAPSRPRAAAEGDAEILRWLATAGYPAERLASTMPVSQLAGCPVLITEYAEPVPREHRREAIRAAGGLPRLGALLGKLTTLDAPPGVPSRPGGAWHQLAEGHPREELGAARAALSELAAGASGTRLAQLDTVRAALEEADDGDGLPESFIHPDFVLANVVATPEPGLVVVDWTGAGRGPRAWPLAFLLWAEAQKNAARVDLVLAGYRRRIALEPAELARLGGLIRTRPLAITAWRLARGDIGPAQAAAVAASVCEQSDAVAARARTALARLATG